MGITRTQNEMLDKAYIYFNAKLFNNKLPDVMIVFNRKPKSRGYIHYQRLKERDATNALTEIALNPDTFVGREDIEILSTLVHEMVHLLCILNGENPVRNYHSKDWAEEMKAIGLYPSSTGEPGGKETGQSMSHYIIQGGMFEKAAGAFLLDGKKILFESPILPGKERGKRVKTRSKYSCGSCDLNVWAKPGAKIACGECRTLLVEDVDDEN